MPQADFVLVYLSILNKLFYSCSFNSYVLNKFVAFELNCSREISDFCWIPFCYWSFPWVLSCFTICSSDWLLLKIRANMIKLRLYRLLKLYRTLTFELLQHWLNFISITCACIQWQTQLACVTTHSIEFMYFLWELSTLIWLCTQSETSVCVKLFTHIVILPSPYK